VIENVVANGVIRSMESCEQDEMLKQVQHDNNGEIATATTVASRWQKKKCHCEERFWASGRTGRFGRLWWSMLSMHHNG